MKRKTVTVFNYAGFNVAWLATVWGAGNGYPWLGPLSALLFIPLHLYFSDNRRGELKLFLKLALLGTLLETGFSLTGLVEYHGNIPGYPLAPPYITTLWMLYASTLNYSMAWMHRARWIATVSGAVFGPVSYLIAAGLGAVSLPGGWTPLLLLGLCWAPVNAGSVQLAAKVRNEAALQ